jgi:uncharacterized delta-60 repeat protein
MKTSCSLLRRIGFVSALTLGAWVNSLYAQPGSQDTGFNAVATTGQVGFSVAVQPDGKIIAVGTFGVMRFLSDGAVDPSFHSIAPGPPQHPGGDSRLGAVKLRPDGRIVVTGSFSNSAGGTLPALMLLNSNGSIDPSFTLDPRVFAAGRLLALQPDGKILTGGSYERGEDTGNLIRLLPDGSLDPDWHASWSTSSGGWEYYSLALTPDGRIYAGTWSGLSRANPDGSLDETFVVDSGTGPFASLALQPDGKILVGHYGDGAGFGQVRRFLPNGLDDPDWTRPEIGGGDAVVYALLPQPDGKVLVGGNNLQSFNGIPNAGVGRLNPNGSVDTTFDSRADLHYYRTEDLALAPDGKVIVGAWQLDVAAGYVAAPGVSRLNNDAGPFGIEFTAATYVVHEGDKWVKIPVRRTGSSDRLAIVRYSVHPGTATRGRDYFGGDGALLFPRGQTVSYIRLYIVSDHRTEGFETVLLSLNRVLGGKLGPQTRAILTILDR